MRTRARPDGMVLVNGVGLGGTTTLSAGNALRLDARSARPRHRPRRRVRRGLPRDPGEHRRTRSAGRELTRQLLRDLPGDGPGPQPTPKMGDYERCTDCGRCVLGCPYGVKWDSRRFLDDAIERGARVVTGLPRRGGRHRGRPGDRRVGAGGLWRAASTPPTWSCSRPVAWPRRPSWSAPASPPSRVCSSTRCSAWRRDWPRRARSVEMTMPFVVQRQHYIISPYFDYLSFFFNRAWR